MSFKGIGKAVARAPQSFKQKLNMGEQTNDPVYLDAERRFKELDTETRKLSTETSRYFSAINGMLDHQIGFAKAMEEIFKPISGVLSDPNSVVPEDNPKGIEASEEYRTVVAELQETLKPDLELIEDRIVKPAQEMLKIISSIRKMSVKRNHKQIDLDRRLGTYNKYANKKGRTEKDDEKMYKAQAELEVAQQEYNYYNDMLKTELPMLFQIQSEFVKPLFVSFYYMQLNIFYSLFNKLHDMKITYFDLGSDIMEHFHASRGNIEEQTDALTITHFRVGYSKSKLEMTRRRYGSAGSSEPQSPLYNSSSGYNSVSSVHYPATGNYETNAQPPPLYSPSPATATTSYTLPSTAPMVETCTALYEYTAQVEGDLTFPVNAIIEIEDRSDAQGWWVGRYNGKRGNFPGNYVRLNKA